MNADTELINRITTTAMQELNKAGATEALALFHRNVGELSYSISGSFPRSMVIMDSAKVILSAWKLALNSAESPDDILQAIRSLLSPLEES